MIFKRVLPCAVALAFLIPAAPAYAQDAGGGAGAPAAGAVPEAAQTDPAEPAVPAVPAQDETPTTPGGEEQPPSAEPTPENAPGETGGGSAGGLPRTGWQAFALLSIGLGLLLAGGALWPTSSWPPPRDRLSRSLPRR